MRTPLDAAEFEAICLRRGLDPVQLRAGRRREAARLAAAKAERQRRVRMVKSSLVCEVETAIAKHGSDDFGEVYFIVCDRFVKIGYAAYSVAERIKAISICNPLPLRIAGVIPGPVKLETALHGVFRDFHHRGEWFHLHDRVEETFALLRKSKRSCFRKPRHTS